MSLLVASVLAMLVGGWLLLRSLLRLVSLHARNRVHKLAVLPEQRIAFDAPGTYVLHVEGPRFRCLPPGIGFVLRDAMTGGEVSSSPVLAPTRSSGFSTARVSVRTFRVERPGEYLFTLQGLPPTADVSRVSLIFAHPYAVQAAALTLGIVAGAAFLLVGFILTVNHLAD